MKLVATLRQTEKGKYYMWESGTAIQENFKGKAVKRKVFVFFEKSCKKPVTTPVKISVIDGFRSFYQWTNEEGKPVVISTLVIQNYEIAENQDRRFKENKNLPNGVSDKDLFTNANGVVPF